MERVPIQQQRRDAVSTTTASRGTVQSPHRIKPPGITSGDESVGRSRRTTRSTPKRSGGQYVPDDTQTVFQEDERSEEETQAIRAAIATHRRTREAARNDPRYSVASSKAFAMSAEVKKAFEDVGEPNWWELLKTHPYPAG